MTKDMPYVGIEKYPSAADEGCSGKHILMVNNYTIQPIIIVEDYADVDDISA